MCEQLNKQTRLIRDVHLKMKDRKKYCDKETGTMKRMHTETGRQKLREIEKAIEKEKRKKERKKERINKDNKNTQERKKKETEKEKENENKL